MTSDMQSSMLDYLKGTNNPENIPIEEKKKINPSEKIDQFIQTDFHGDLKGLDYITLSLEEMPSGHMYSPDTQIMIRALDTREILAYSTVDGKNVKDIQEKMDILLDRAVIIKRGDIRLDFNGLQEGDRIYIILALRELSFKSGNYYTVKSKCKCGKENEVPLTRQYTRNREIDPSLWEYFDSESRSFIFKIGDEDYSLRPPTIQIRDIVSSFYSRNLGMIESEDLLIFKEFNEVAPYWLFDSDNFSVTDENLMAQYNIYKEMGNEVFVFLTEITSELFFGIKELQYKCSCGREVHTPINFPNGYRSLFGVGGGWKSFLSKQNTTNITPIHN